MFITKVVHHLRRMHLAGWIELDGKLLSGEELMQVIRQDPGVVSRFGGEFYLEFGSCAARDYYGIIQGPCPAGTIICDGSVAGFVRPSYPALPLADAIRTAVRLRSDIGITALSGGVDSALIAAIARQPCLVTGMEGCHDIRQAEKVAALLDLPLHIKVVTPEEVENALPVVIGLIDDDPTPVDLGIGTTLYFVAETAGKLGHQRILTGQGADELFGGYARYQDAPACLLNMMFADDFASLDRQRRRDQGIAGSFGTSLSMPYLDVRVVCAADALPPADRVQGNVRKKPLREVARQYLPEFYANYEKKAMQYGTGIWKEIKRIARQNGYHNSVSDFIAHLRRT